MDSFKGMTYFGGGLQRPRSAGNVDGHAATSLRFRGTPCLDGYGGRKGFIREERVERGLHEPPKGF